MVERAAMQVAEGIEPSQHSACSACGEPLPRGKLVCAKCGAAHGEANRCPHCHAVADVEPHASLGFRCLVCGGPRLPLDVPGVVLGPRTRAALELAGSEQTKHLMFSAIGWLLSGMGALGLLVASIVLLAASPGAGATAATLLACGVPIAAGLAALRKASAARQKRKDALHTAQVHGLHDVQIVTGPLDARRAAELLRTHEEGAELLLAEASVGTLLSDEPLLRVSPDVATAERTRSAHPPLVRVQGVESASGSPATAPMERREGTGTEINEPAQTIATPTERRRTEPS